MAHCPDGLGRSGQAHGRDGLPSRLPRNLRREILLQDLPTATRARAAQSLFSERWVEGWRHGTFGKFVPHQPVLKQLSDPLRVPHVGLAARDGLHVRGVEQPHLHRLLERIEHRLPVRRGRLHRRDLDTLLDQPLPQQPQRPGRGLERAHLGVPGAATRARGAHAHRDRGLGHIQPGDPLEHHFHHSHAPFLRSASRERFAAAPPGGPSARKQTHVLAATIRHPENPAPYTRTGFTRTTVQRRRRATPPFSSPATTAEAVNVTPGALSVTIR